MLAVNFCIFSKIINFMKKYINLLLIAVVIFSCSETETDPVLNFSVGEHIELIKNHDNKIEISFDDLPEVSQNYINSLENNITAELILHAQDIGYEIKIRRESRSLVSLLNSIIHLF